MGKLKEGEQPVNVDLPADLVKRVESYRHRRELANKKDAYRELLEKGLEVADRTAPEQ